MAIEIKPVDEKSLDFVVDYCLRSVYKAYNGEQFRLRKQKFMKQLEAGDYQCFVAYEEGRPIGFIDIEKRQYENRETLWINEMYVHAVSRGKGIAGLLKKHIEPIAKNMGFIEIYTSTEPGNKQNLSVIEKSGYKLDRMVFKKRI